MRCSIWISLVAAMAVLGCWGAAASTSFGMRDGDEGQRISILDKYGEIEKGDWVKLERSDDTENIILVADKDGDKVTIEIKEIAGEKGQKLLVLWRQVVIDTKQREVILVRTKDAFTGEIEEHPPEPNEEIDDVIQATFTKLRDEKLSQEVEEKDPETGDYEKKRRKFDCVVYKGIVFGDRYIEMWYAKDIPLYPVKANLPGLSTTIKLVRYGKNLPSKFEPAD